MDRTASYISHRTPKGSSLGAALAIAARRPALTAKTCPVTPDGRYLMVRGRLWRRANPHLAPDVSSALVRELMIARRNVHLARQGGDETAEARAHAAVDAAKTSLGERGPVWWDDGAPDLNRHMAHTTLYADWSRDAHAGDGGFAG